MRYQAQFHNLLVELITYIPVAKSLHIVPEIDKLSYKYCVYMTKMPINKNSFQNLYCPQS